LPGAGAILALALCAASASALAQAPRLEPVVSGLESPWSFAFLPGGGYLITERPGQMRVASADGKLGGPLAGVPEVSAGGQGGLLDVTLDSGFAQNRTLYFCYAEPGEAGNSTALARARLGRDLARLEDVTVIFRQQPKVRSSHHFGCRIVEAKDGTLFLTLGERNSRRQDSQTLDNHHGKVVRIAKDGSVPKDNPFAGRPGALPEIYSYGHRNPQGAVLDDQGRLWIHEHGPQGGDEVNLVQPGRNYGWPVISHGVNYGGGRIGDGITAKDGMEQPVLHWTPSIAPSGMALLRSDRYGSAWRGSLFVGSLKFEYVERVALDGTRVVERQKLFPDVGQRVRDVREGPDGLLYVLTEGSRGRLLRAVPAAAPQ
jgi:glucose/arabinose dehydrogenase